MEELIQAKVLVPGDIRGEVLVSNEPLSFWGGYDPQSGEITDRRHPLSGEIAAGKVLALPFTRGSSTTTAVLLEAQRNGVAPLALLAGSVDAFLSLASVVADEMYSKPIPVYALQPEDFAQLRTGDQVAIQADGRVRVTSER
jgi:predicted aconitase with swiveling domain